MALNFLLKRSGTPDKRPDPTSMALGELDLNYDAETGGVFYKDSDGNVVKVGSAQVSATAPNATPAGSAGNSTGEFWYDTANSELKLWDGSAWVPAGGGGEVSGVTGIAPVSVDNTDPANPIISVDASSTSAAGVVQLDDTVTSTSTTEAATANAVKTAYDAGVQGQTDAAAAQATADVAVPNASYTALGDVLGGTGAGTYSALALGTDGDVLTADSTCATGLKWAPAEGGIPASAFTVKSGLLAGTGAGTYTEVAPGAPYQVLTIAPSKGSCDIFWTDPAGLATPNSCGLVFGLVDYGTGNGNASIGEGSLGQLSIGVCNTALGFQALGFTNEGTGNIGIGYCAGTDVTCGSFNVVIGTNVQPASLTGSCQLAIGFASGQNWLTGDSTKAIKPGAGIIDCTNSTGTAGQVLMSDGANAICWGTAGGGIDPSILTAKGSLITASAASTPVDLAVGFNGQVLMACSTCSSGLAWASLSNATPTAAGIIKGQTSGFLLNTALGNNASNTSITGERNTTLGAYAGLSVSSGSWNTITGQGAAASLETGCENSWYGYNSGSSSTGDRNTGVGASVLPQLTTGSSNIAIGQQSGFNLTTGSFNVAIGDCVQVASATDSCQLAIGFSSTSNWLTGDSTKAIKPGAGIIDCAGSCGTAGQVLMSNGANAICWGTAGGGGGSGTVTDITAGAGLTGGTITTSGTIAIDSACVLEPADFTAKGQILVGTGAGTYCALPAGADGQILYSNSFFGSGVYWGAAPAASTPENLGLTYGRVDGPAPFPSFSCDNASFGYSAMGCQLTTGAYNVAVGNSSAYWMSTGCNNTAVGYTSLFAQTAATENDNTAVGYGALANAGGSGNVAVGSNAGYCVGCNNVGGDYNIAIGLNAANTLESGSQNVVIGCGVQPASISGSCQLAIGFATGQCWLSGTSTKAIRPGAGIIDCTGSCGTAGQVLMSDGANAICWGAAGGASPATPTVAGVVLGCTATTAARGSTSLGSGALISHTTAFYSTVVGADAGAAVTTGNYNTLIGFCAGNKLANGGFSTAVGGLALRNAISTNNNTAVGYNALGQTTGINNTALGTAAGNGVTTGNYNTFIGGNAGASTSTGIANTIISPINALGSTAPVFNVTTENNRFVAGHTGITNAYVQVAWTVVSDARDKIVEGIVPHGLNFVNQLEPKAFHFKEDRESTNPHGPLRYGFLAQDILALEGNDGVIIDAEDPEKLRYNGEALVPVLVNAIKELSAKNDELEARLRALEIPG